MKWPKVEPAGNFGLTCCVGLQEVAIEPRPQKTHATPIRKADLPMNHKWLASIALIVISILGAFVTLDLAYEGPYVSWYNRSHLERARNASLVGRSEVEVTRLFGIPSKVQQHPRAYAYYPYPFLPVSQVKVFCENGMVTGVKLFDD